jgi:predicted dehydrogenase
MSGGQIVEQSTHIVDLMRYLAGDIDRVYADMSLELLKDIDNIDIPDVTSVNFTFDSGAVGHLDCTITQPDFKTGVELLGCDFRIEIDFSSVTIVEKDHREVFKTNTDFYLNQDRAFIEAIRKNDQTRILSSYEDGLQTLAVTLAANQSAELGQPVSIKPLTFLEL